MLRRLAFLSLILPVVAFGQVGSTAFVFKNLNERDGLPYRNARCLHFDRYQRLWIGTEQGLAVYDAGVLKEVPFDPGELPPTIGRIIEDSTGVLWMSTSHGLSRVDPRTREVRSWRIPREDTLNGFPEGINSLFIGSDDHVYCGTMKGLQSFDPERERFDSLALADTWGLGVVAIVRPDSGNTGCWLTSTLKSGLVYYSIERDEVYHKGNNPTDMPLLRGLDAGSMANDVNGNIWMTDWRTYELLRYSPGDRSLRRWKHIPGHPDITVIGWSSPKVDGAGHIWLMDHLYLPTVFDPVDSTVHRLRNVANDPGSIGGNIVYDLKVDAAGNTWVATDNGVSVVVREGLQYSTDFTAHLLQNRWDATLAGMELDGDGRAWLASELGLLRYDPRTREVSKFMVSATTERSSAILGLERMDDELWLATRDGIWRFDINTHAARKFTNYPAGAEHMASTTYAWIVKDAQGGIWSGTWGRGAVHIDPDHTSCQFFEPNNKDPQSIPEGALTCALVARDGTVWMGHGSRGLVRYKGEGHFETISLSTIDGRANTAILLAIQEDPSGRLWLGVKEAGLMRFEPSTRKYQLFGREQGLRMPTVATVLLDKLGRVWVGTNNELAYFDPRKERFVAIPIDHGAEHNDFNSSCIELADGDFVFANCNTLVRFDPLTFEIPPAPPPPALREVRVYGQRLPWLPGDTLLFDHEQDQVDLRFGITAPPDKIASYGYLLEGSSREWTISPNSTASFNNLAPGRYTLVMKVMDRWGNWSGESRAAFFVTPPWWQLSWVRIAFAVLLALTIVGVFRYRIDRIRKQEQRRGEIDRAMDELKLRALRAQMDPHFIFNCLNSIDRYIMTEEKQKASHYLGRFARLIRLILQQSDKVTVPLEREVEMLQYYLELEALRFETPFIWEVKVDPLLANESVELPTMLVQPFVENAIWHGVQHKSGAGRVEAAFRLVGGSVECTIEDDGIGRDASKAINAQRSGVHRSMGMRVSTDRLELFRSLEERDAKVVVHDLRDRNGAALGTRVVITLPLDAGADDNGTNERS